MFPRATVAIVLLAVVLLVPSYGWSADWTFSEAELARLGAGGVLVAADVSSDRSKGDIRAAVKIHAPAERIFRALTECSEVLAYVPHLERCAVLETAPDDSWQVVEHHIHYGWLMPDAYYVIRADYERYTRIRFDNVRGDFRENRGEWQLALVDDGKAVIVTYRVHVVPRFYVPRWILRSAIKRDLPDLMTALRARAEAPEPAAARADAALPTH
jgi:uncharacterized protein YndB with AHSA1/START domain